MEDFSVYNGEGTNLRKAQLRMLDILIEFDKICRNNNIEYWLDSGTLLGAVRHGGFIPWDDDVDICVMRKNYNKLRKVLQKELPNNLVFVDWKTDENFYDKCGRVKDKNSNTHYSMFSHQKEQGLYIDIIILERSYRIFKNMIDPIYGPIFRQVHNFGKEIYHSNKKRLFMKFISYLLYPIVSLLVSLFRLLSFNSKRLFMTYSLMFKSKRDINNIYPLSEIEFERFKFMSPKNPDGYLKLLYGDYMLIPPKENRAYHSDNIIIN